MKYEKAGAKGTNLNVASTSGTSTTSGATYATGGKVAISDHGHSITQPTFSTPKFTHSITQPAFNTPVLGHTVSQQPTFNTPVLGHTITQPAFSASGGAVAERAAFDSGSSGSGGGHSHGFTGTAATIGHMQPYAVVRKIIRVA